MNVLDAIQQRQSIRAFLEKPIEQSIIKDILKIASRAPSGVNTQPWQIKVVTGTTKNTISKKIIAAKENGIAPHPDYQYYPTEWQEPYKSRRKECGIALYSAVGIAKNDKDACRKQWYKNYKFFNAPIGLLFFIDAQLTKGSWLDMGMFLQNVMLAAKGFNLGTCPQAAMAEYPDIVREELKITSDIKLICGIALGYINSSDKINNYRTTREKVESFTEFFC